MQKKYTLFNQLLDAKWIHRLLNCAERRREIKTNWEAKTWEETENEVAKNLPRKLEPKKEPGNDEGPNLELKQE